MSPMTSSRRKNAETVLRSIHLHAPEYDEHLQLRDVKEFLKKTFPAVSVQAEPPILSLIKGRRLDEVSESLARARIKDPTKASQTFEPMYGEVEFEKRAMAGGARVGGMVYNGRKLEDVYSSAIRSGDGLASANVVFTQRLIATYSHDDLRQHLRTVVCGFPSIVSIPGIVEAPAKPREYYMLKQELESRGAGELELHKLKSLFKDRFIDYDDPNLTEALKGISLQAVLFHLTLDPFCDDVTCRLFNAHWQEDLVKSQTTGDHFCGRHQKLLRRLGKLPSVSW